MRLFQQRIWCGAGLVIFGILFATSLVSAQMLGTFNGRVADQQGAVLPGVAVTATNANTGVARTTVTNGEGLYSLPGLEPGVYAIKAELAGFAPMTQTPVTLAVNATLTLDFKLGLAGVSESLTVSSTSPLIEVTQSKVELSIQRNEVQNLPLLTRSVNGLIALLPGAKAVAPFHPYKKESGSVSEGGSAGRTMAETIDGADNRDNVVGGAAVNITVEAIDQFQVASHQFSAGDGRSSGSTITILTKSGTNTLQGSGFFYGRDSSLEAEDYFSKQAGVPKPPFSRQQSGGSVGGPIMRNRAFFFGAFEGIRENTSIAVPNNLFNQMQLLIPFGAEPVHAILQPYWETRYLAKANVQINQAHSLMWRYTGQNTHRQDPSNAVNTDISAPNLETHNFSDLVVQHGWIVGAGVLNQLTAHVSYFRDYLGPTLAGQRPAVSQYLDALGQLPITNNLSFPSVRIGQPVAGLSSNSGQTMLQVRDDVSKQMGRHALKMGSAYAWFPTLGGQVGPTAASLAFFDDPSVILGNTNGKYPQGFQTPGIVRQWTNTPPVLASSYLLDGAKQFNAYIQDDWRVRSRLTLNLGLRYDLDINLYDQKANAQNLTYQILRAIGSPYGVLPTTPTKDLGPRVGFAYDFRGDGQRVLRAGYGLYFDQICQTGTYAVSDQNRQPYIFTSTLTNTAIGIGQLANYRLGIDPPPAQPAVATGFPAGKSSNGAWYDPHLNDGRSNQFHVGYSHEVTPNTVVSADFTHIVGFNDAKTVQINPFVNGVRVLAPALARAYGDPNLLGSINIFATIGRTRYDELAVQFQQRLPRTTLRVSYTLSGAYAYGGQIVGSQAACCQAQDQFNIFGPGEWGPANTDERHRVVIMGVFELPGGIQLSPVFQAATPLPYTLTAGLDLNGDGTLNDRYVDPATGQQVAVNSQRGDPFVLLDMRATKSFSLSGTNRKLNVFAEFFNLLNRANFGSNYSGNARSVAFEQPVGFIPGFYGYPFQVQLGARFQF